MCGNLRLQCEDDIMLEAAGLAPLMLRKAKQDIQLNTIFDSLNRLIRSINATLLGSQPLGDQAIRFVISSQLGG